MEKIPVFPTTNGSKRRTIAYSLSEETIARVEEEAKRTNLSRSKVVQVILDMYFQEN